MRTTANDQPENIRKPIRNRALSAPDWMGPAQKKQFRTIVRQRFDAKEPPSTAELDRISDYLAGRYRIEMLRDLLKEDEGDWMRGNKFAALKSRILQNARQIDAAERQSHQLAAGIGLI